MNKLVKADVHLSSLTSAWILEDRSNDEMLIESVMCEWSQIIEITSDFDKESRKLILTTWEQEKRAAKTDWVI